MFNIKVNETKKFNTFDTGDYYTIGLLYLMSDGSKVEGVMEEEYFFFGDEEKPRFEVQPETYSDKNIDLNTDTFKALYLKRLY